MGLLFAMYTHHYYDAWSHRGREAFLAYQGHRFDRDMLVPRHSIAGVVLYIVIVCVCIGVYELIAAGITKVLKHDLSNGTE
jgi:hypothetical protein